LLRCELDAAFFHLYGIGHDDADCVLDTFPIVRKNDEKAHGEYRTKRVILEIYDAMAEVMKANGKWPVVASHSPLASYQTRLDPPPADAPRKSQRRCDNRRPGKRLSAWQPHPWQPHPGRKLPHNLEFITSLVMNLASPSRRRGARKLHHRRDNWSRQPRRSSKRACR